MNTNARTILVLLGALLLLDSPTVLAGSASVDVVESFLPSEQIHHFQTASKFGSQRAPNGRFQADVILPSSLVTKIRRVALQNGKLNTNDNNNNNNSKKENKSCPAEECRNGNDNETKKRVKTSFIDATTRLHQDRYVTDETSSLVDDENVAIVFLNTNTNAAFVHGERSIPVIAGNLVTFPGTIEHNTIIKEGFVHMIGPFTTESFITVGESCNCDNYQIDCVTGGASCTTSCGFINPDPACLANCGLGLLLCNSQCALTCDVLLCEECLDLCNSTLTQCASYCDDITGTCPVDCNSTAASCRATCQSNACETDIPTSLVPTGSPTMSPTINTVVPTGSPSSSLPSLSSTINTAGPSGSPISSLPSLSPTASSDNESTTFLKKLINWIKWAFSFQWV